MGIFVNGRDIGLAKTHQEVMVPSKSSSLLNYSFTLSSAQLRQLMGKDNNLTFKTAIELDLTDYTNMLPNFQLAVSEDFDLESSELKPYINKLLQKRSASLISPMNTVPV